jgi:LDH2 family malate/lactate/ureidoglycolate dehydrogenase
MDDLQHMLKDAPKVPGENRIYIHGEKEYEESERRSRDGIPLNAKVVSDLRAIASEVDVEPLD